MATVTGESILRAETIDKMVKGFALQQFKLKQIVMVSNSSSWSESYFQETAADLTAKGTRNIKGVPRLAQFPYGEVSWEKKTAYMEKYALEGVIAWEDEKTNNIDVIARTLLRIARGVAKAVDDEIWDKISESQSPSSINTVAIAGGNEWDSATAANRDPVQDVLNSQKEIAIASLRGGTFNSEHSIIFAGCGESLEITHRSQSLEPFARGTLQSARWIVKQSPGVYEMLDMLGLPEVLY